MAKPENIRTHVIKPNMAELAAFGVISRREKTSGPRGGRPGTAYYLNEEQALLVCLLSRTEKAKQARAEVIRVFTAWRRGELTIALQPATTPSFTTVLNPLSSTRSNSPALLYGSSVTSFSAAARSSAS